MSINRPCLSKCAEQQLCFLKQESCVLHNCYYKLIFYRNSLFSQSRESRLFSQKFSFLFFQVNVYFFDFIFFIYRRKNFISFFFIISEKSYVHIRSSLIVTSHFYPYMLSIQGQSNCSKQIFQWDTIVNTHPLAKEVIDYLGGAFFAF
jgi:hypothetical protein